MLSARLFLTLHAVRVLYGFVFHLLLVVILRSPYLSAVSLFARLVGLAVLREDVVYLLQTVLAGAAGLAVGSVFMVVAISPREYLSPAALVSWRTGSPAAAHALVFLTLNVAFVGLEVVLGPTTQPFGVVYGWMIYAALHLALFAVEQYTFHVGAVVLVTVAMFNFFAMYASAVVTLLLVVAQCAAAVLCLYFVENSGWYPPSMVYRFRDPQGSIKKTF